MEDKGLLIGGALGAAVGYLIGSSGKAQAAPPGENPVHRAIVSRIGLADNYSDQKPLLVAPVMAGWLDRDYQAAVEPKAPISMYVIYRSGPITYDGGNVVDRLQDPHGIISVWGTMAPVRVAVAKLSWLALDVSLDGQLMLSFSYGMTTQAWGTFEVNP